MCFSWLNPWGGGWRESSMILCANFNTLYILILVLPCFLLHVNALDWIHRMSSPGQRLATIKSMLLWCWWLFEACRMSFFQTSRASRIKVWRCVTCYVFEQMLHDDVFKKSQPVWKWLRLTKSKDRKRITWKTWVFSRLWNCNRTRAKICQVLCFASILQIDDPLPRSRFHCDKSSIWWILFHYNYNTIFRQSAEKAIQVHQPFPNFPCETNSPTPISLVVAS